MDNLENKNEMNLETVTAETDKPQKKSRKVKKFLLFLPLIAVAVIAILLSFGGDDAKDASLGFTLDEFVERYNETVDIHLKDDSDAETNEKVESWLKLDIDYFVQNEENNNFYTANNSNNVIFDVLMNDSGEYVQAVTYRFTSNLDNSQIEQFLIFCKWFNEAVKPDMGMDYYTDILVEAIEKGEVHKDGLAYLWDEANGYYSYGIYYVAQ